MPATFHRFLRGAVPAVVMAMLSSCTREPANDATRSQTPASAAATADIDTVRSVVATEELILELNPRLKALQASLVTARCLRAGDDSPFAGTVSVAGLATPLTRISEAVLPDSTVTSFGLALSQQPAQVERAELAIWEGMLVPEAQVVSAAFSLIRGAFASGGESEDGSRAFVTPCGFEALVKNGSGWQWLRGEQELRWTKVAGAGGGDWRISGWHQLSLEVLESPALLFEDVLTAVLPDARDRERAVTSTHQQILVDSYFGGKPARTPGGYRDKRFFPDAVNIHPALSVVDIDRDGWDDLYVCVRWGRNMLFRNRGDGTFEEVAGHYGLDIEGRSTSATFADFDNDGDADLMLGRSLERSQYLINAGGNFIEASFGNIDGELPCLVTSTSAADYNGDGLLDIFFCTYSPLDITARITGRSASLPDWAETFLSAGEAEEVRRRYADYHGFLGQVGPPNTLFVNRGDGKFARAPESGTLAGYRNTFQATWSDFDKDGDPDLYVANDFAPDHFYRNDAGAGFTDISNESGTGLMGFGMGAAFGDYDNDGWQDLYVSNMYSKAGRRITAQVPGLDQRMVAGAEGNYLFRNLGASGTFERVSGLEKPGLPVARAGWSWGGQFADFDNDGFLDLYVSSGFYTPPDSVANSVDL